MNAGLRIALLAALLSWPGSSKAAVTLSPASILQCGNVELGQSSAPKRLTVTNTGAAAIAVGQLVLVSGSATEFAFTGDLCSLTSLAPGATCTVDVVFTPQGLGSRTGQVSVPSDDATTPDVRVYVAGWGMEQHTLTVTVEPPGAGTVRSTDGKIDCPGQCSTTAVAPFGIALDAVAAAGHAFVAWTGCSSTSAAHCVVQVPANADAAVTASFRALSPPVAEVSPTRLEFGNALVGEATSPREIQVKNLGELPLHLGAATLVGAQAGAFVLSDDACSLSTLAAGATCKLRVAFRATGLGAHEATLRLLSDDAASPAEARLSGTGARQVRSFALHLTTTPTVGGTVSGTAFFCGNGGCDLTFPEGFVEHVVAKPGPYEAAEPIAGCDLPSGPCTVTFDRDRELAVTFRSVPAPRLSLPERLASPQAPVGQSGFTGITLENGGDAELSVSRVAVEGRPELSLANDGCTGKRLAAGAFCAVQVLLTPKAIVEYEGTLVVESNDPGAPVVRRALRGQGMAAVTVASEPRLSVEPAVLELGSVAVGGTSASRELKLTNVGAVDCPGAAPSLGADAGLAASGFYVVDDRCGHGLAPGESCSLFVAFSPVAEGQASAALTARGGSAALSGVGLPAPAAPKSGCQVVGGDTVLGLVLAAAGAVRLRRRRG